MFLRRKGFYGMVDDTDVSHHFVVADGEISFVGKNQEPPAELCAVVEPTQHEIVGYWSPKEYKAQFFKTPKRSIRYTLCKIVPPHEAVRREKEYDNNFLRSLNIRPHLRPD